VINWRAIVERFVEYFRVEKQVLVTGGTGVLGGEIVSLLLRSTPRFNVIANFSQDEKRAALLQDKTGCRLHRADVGDENQVEEMFATLPRLFAIVHAAGVSQDELMLRQSREDWNQSLRANADSAFLVARQALQKLEHGGRLIFLASRVGEQGNAGQTAYSASKAATIALMKCAAREGAESRIAVNAICPGFVPSAMSEDLSTPRLEKARAASVLGELGKAQQTAGLVRWLLQEESVGISGQVFHCDSRI